MEQEFYDKMEEVMKPWLPDGPLRYIPEPQLEGLASRSAREYLGLVAEQSRALSNAEWQNRNLGNMTLDPQQYMNAYSSGLGGLLGMTCTSASLVRYEQIR